MDLTGLLVCPRHKTSLKLQGEKLHCSSGCEFQVVSGVPVMLLDDVPCTIGVMRKSIEAASRSSDVKTMHGLSEKLYLDSIGIDEREKERVLKLARMGNQAIDPVVSGLIAATNGNMYKKLRGKLNTYPIPDIPLEQGEKKKFLDVGCNWGRWCISASRKGYEVTGIDPSLGAILAAKRVSAQFGLSINYVVADARYMPFPDDYFDSVFSYSVLQHMNRHDVVQTLAEIKRILAVGGRSLIQMANARGIRNFQVQLKRGFRDVDGFDVRYRTLGELHQWFQKKIGLTTYEIDCFFGLGLQASDIEVVPKKYRIVIKLSEWLKHSSFKHIFKPFADSVYMESTKR